MQVSLRYIGLVCAVLAGVIGLIGFHLQADNARAALVTQAELRTYARFASFEYDILIEESRHVLEILSRLPQVQGTNAAACNELLASISKAAPRYASLSVIGVDGNLWCSSQPFTPPVYVGDRLHFTGPMETKSFTVGDYIIGRLTGKPVLPFALPILDAKGNVTKVVTLGLDLSWLADFGKTLGLPPGSTAIVVDNAGTTLARYPEPSDMGKPAPEVDYRLDKIEYLEQGLGQVRSFDASGTPLYLIAVPLHRESQTGYLHLIMSIPVNRVGQ